MMLATLAGGLFGAAVLVLVRALSGPRATLVDQLAAADGAGVPAAGRGRTTGAGRAQVLQMAVKERLAAAGWGGRLVDAQLRADLELLGTDRDEYVARKVVAAVAVLVVAPAVLAVLAAAVGLPWLAGAWVALLAAGLAFVLPDQRVRSAAASRRRDFVATLAAYMDLVAMRAASGSGVPEAVRDAALIGTGYAWRRVRLALDDARMEGKPPAEGLSTLGREVGVPELSDLAGQLALVGSQGGQAEATLRAKAEALRERQLAELHGDANARTQTMQVAGVLLGFGFLLLIGYPALAAVLAL